jgi:hypothetical protein
MGLRLATTARNNMAQVIRDLLDADAGAGKIEVYTGSQPATPNTAATGTLLATFTLADPSFSAPATGVLTLQGTPLSASGVAAGTAGWFRASDNSGDAVMDGTVSATGGGGNLELNTTTVSIGLSVQITGGTVTMPVGA